MKLGNPHLTIKLSAMTEAAMKEEPPGNSTPAHSPNMNGKRVVINLDNFKDATSL
jgi:G protein-coupled receptor 158